MAGGPSGRKEDKGKKETIGYLSGGLIALIGVLAGERKEGEKVGARRIPRGCGGGRRAGGKKKGRGEGRLTGGAQASATAKKKKRERDRWAGAGRLDGPAGLAGPKGKQVRFCFFLFFFFKPLFKPLFFSNSNQTFSNFFSRIL
jgi:hypothetical protein